MGHRAGLQACAGPAGAGRIEGGGRCGADPAARQLTKSRRGVRGGVGAGYRDRGLGSALIRELCDIADDAGLEKVLFEVVADREQEAVRAAEWLGFLRLATIENGAVDPLGHHHDVVLMAMPLGRWYPWTKF